MIYNVALVSSVQQNDSVIHVHISILFQILFWKNLGLFLLSACHLVLFLGMRNNFLMEWWHCIYTYICIYKVEGLWMMVSSIRGDLTYTPSCSRVGAEPLIWSEIRIILGYIFDPFKPRSHICPSQKIEFKSSQVKA